jgi:uroporphyrinogen decarboxylase
MQDRFRHPAQRTFPLKEDGMNHRERVLAALNHEEPDRVPIDLGGTLATMFNINAYEKLKEYLGIETPSEILSLRSMIAKIEEEILLRYDVDTRALPLLGNSRPTEHLPDGSFVDEWGIKRMQPHPRGHFMDVDNPLDGDYTLDDLDRYPWPDPEDPGYTEGLAEAAERLHHETDYAVILTLPVGPVHLGQWLRGYERWLMDLVDNVEFFEAMTGKVTDIWLRISQRMLDAVGSNADIICYGDDIAFQSGPMVRHDMYEARIKPHQRRIFDLLRGHSGKVLYHSCGSVVSLIEDLIELGVDALNPVQVNAARMDTDALKSEFGDRIAFWGAVDTQRVLPTGTPDEVRAEVRRRIEDLAPGGGYVLSSVHNIQAEVPPENIEAMLKEALVAGRYPLGGD